MGSNGTGQGPRPKHVRPRYVFQVDSDSDGGVIRVLDTRNGTVFREIPVAQFVAYAKKNRNVKGFLLGKVS